MMKTQMWRVLFLLAFILMVGPNNGQLLAHPEIPEPPGMDIIERTVKILDRAVRTIETTLGRGRTLRQLVDYYRFEMMHRGWILRELEIEDREAEMEFTRGKAEVEIEIKREKRGFKVQIESSDD